MNAKQQVINSLKTIYDEGTVNAMDIFKGWTVDTGLNGWHFKKFGQSRHNFIGNSITEVKAWVAETKEQRG